MAEDKPVVESFQLDHTKVKAPYVRYIDTETGPHGDVISNYDLRLVQPNENAIPTGGLHTIEHTIAVLLRERIPGYIDCSPFGIEGIVGIHRLRGHMGRRAGNHHRKLRQLPRPQPVHRQGMVQGHPRQGHQLRPVRTPPCVSVTMPVRWAW